MNVDETIAFYERRFELMQRRTDAAQRMADAATELVASVSFDVNGAMIGGKWMGGHGGLVSQETIQKTDALRRAVAALPKETP